MKHKRKTIVILLSAALLAACLAACSGSAAVTPGPAASAEASAEPVELTVFAAASLTETLTTIQEMYQEGAPNVTLNINFDSSGTLKTQIEQGADCDVFLSASQKHMNALDGTKDADSNPDGLDCILSDTRFNFVSNSVVLVVPEGNPTGVTSFEDLASNSVSLIALGNSDVPVGQYAEQVLTYLELWDTLNAQQKITFGSTTKEVLAQVETAAVDCGIVYSTDAATSDDVEVVATAPEGSHKDIIYPAAIVNTSENVEAAQDFLDYLSTDACSEVFSSVGFIPLS